MFFLKSTRMIFPIRCNLSIGYQYHSAHHGVAWLTCWFAQWAMRIISDILTHMGCWLVRSRQPLKCQILITTLKKFSLIFSITKFIIFLKQFKLAKRYGAENLKLKI